MSYHAAISDNVEYDDDNNHDGECTENPREASSSPMRTVYTRGIHNANM